MNRVNGNKLETVEIDKNAVYNCVCGKKFKTNAGLWKHQRTCDGIKEQADIHDTI